jgi:hypothetical protein
MLTELRVVNRKSKQKTIPFELRAPDAGATCPISQDLIAESELDFLGGCTLVADRPELRAMRLKCGHEFSAMLLVYHWARGGDVRCPVCRAGPHGTRLNLARLPDHFRSAMCRRVRAQKRSDAAEQRRSDEEAARSMQGEVLVINLVPDAISLVVARRFGEAAYRMPCNFFLSGSEVLLSCPVPLCMFVDFHEFKVFGLFKTGDVETRFDETGWIEWTDETKFQRANVGSGHTFMYYTVRAQDDRTALLEWRVKATFFATMSEVHSYKIGLVELGLFSLDL